MIQDAARPGSSIFRRLREVDVNKMRMFYDFRHSRPLNVRASSILLNVIAEVPYLTGVSSSMLTQSDIWALSIMVTGYNVSHNNNHYWWIAEKLKTCSQ